MKVLFSILFFLPCVLIAQFEAQFSNVFNVQKNTQISVEGVFKDHYYVYLKGSSSVAQLLTFDEQLKMQEVIAFEKETAAYKVLDFFQLKDTLFSICIDDQVGEVYVGPYRIDSTYMEKARTAIELGEPLEKWRQNVRTLKSQDQEKALFYVDNRTEGELFMIHLSLYDAEQRRFLPRTFDLEVNNKDSRLLKTDLSNEGKMYLLFQTRDTKVSVHQSGRYVFELYEIDIEKNIVSILKVEEPSLYLDQVDFKLDYLQGEIVISALYSTQSYLELHGILLWKSAMEKLVLKKQEKKAFSQYELRRLGAKNITDQAKGAEDLKLKKVVLRSDGGVLIIGEVFYENIVETANSSIYLNPYGSNQQVYYNYNDIQFISIDSTGSLDWQVTGYKRQEIIGDKADEYASIQIGISNYGVYTLFNRSVTKPDQLQAFLVDVYGNIVKKYLCKDRLILSTYLQINQNEFIGVVEKLGDYRLMKVKVVDVK